MTDKQRLAVLRLFEVRCPECTTGLGPLHLKHEGRPDCCSRCNGTGYHISGATRSNWPWWCCYECRADAGVCECGVEPQYLFFVPDFPNDPAASLVLADRMGKAARAYSIRLPQDVEHLGGAFASLGAWAVVTKNNGEFREYTLGAALLAALHVEKETA